MPARSLSRQLMHVMVNPGVALVLRSRLHGVLSGSLLLLTLQGRRSQRWHALPVQYAQEDGAIYVLPSAPSQKAWWRNLIGGAPVFVRIRGQTVAGHAEAVVGARSPNEVIEGLKVYYAGFPTAARLHQVHRRPDGTFDSTALRTAAESSIIVRIRTPQAV